MDDIEPVDVVVRDDDGGWREVTLRVRDSGVRVAELAGALGAPGAGVTVDGREVALATPIVTSGLRRGSIVTRRGVRSTLAAPPAGALRWTGGVDAGRAHRLAAGVTVIGRAPSVNLRCRDPQVAPFHCLVRSGPAGIAVQPLVPAAELVAGNRWRIGARHAELLLPSPPAPSVPTGPVRPGEWTAGLSRPPRPAPAPMPAAVRAPASDRRGGHGSPGAAPIVGAVVAAFGSVAAAMIFGQPALLLLGGLGALGSVGSWLFQRGSGARAARAGRRLARVELAAFDAALGDQAAAAAACRWARAVELTDAVERARHHDSRLWERRRHHPDHPDVVIGVGAVPWYPIVDRLPDEPPAAALAVMAGHDRLEPAPVSLGLRAGVVLGIVGDAPAARSLARALVVQAAVTSGPADLAIGVRADGPAWEWARWLPHSLGPDEETGDRTRLVVVDCSGPVVARAELTGRFGPVAGIVMAPDIVGLPSCCTHVATVDGVATVSLHDVADGSTIEGIVGAGASVSTAAGVARALALYDDPELAVAGRGLPAAIDLGDLLGATALDGPALASAWRELGPDRGLRAPIGRSEDGVFEIDLVEDGPHALIAGTTGAGKSELLRTLVAGLAARSSPRDLTFVLIDYKGGSAFDACASFPHVGGVVTDLDDRLAARALRGLDAELRRRERRLREAGATDIGDARRRGLELPRLVVVVDEMAGLAADLPDFLHALVDVAQRGRSLGLHLVLATQRPAGVVSDDIRANTNLRIALRMQSPAESHDVLGRPDAASLRAERPGRAFVRVGPAEPVAVQVAMVSRTGVAAARPAVEVLPIGTVPVAPAAGVGSSTLERLAAAARAAAAELGVAAARAPWLEPLPDVLVLDDLPAGASALADDPDRQEQRPVWWCRPDGNLLCTGIAGSGASAALVAVAAAAASRSAAADLHLYAVDMGAGALAPLASLPHCAGVLGASASARCAWSGGSSARWTSGAPAPPDPMSSWSSTACRRGGPPSTTRAPSPCSTR